MDARTRPPVTEPDLERLIHFFRSRNALILSGAGCSTESGIPDYRGPEGALRHREPMRFQQFMGSHRARQRYWARSARGWSRVAAARPNPTHHAVARLESAGLVRGVITQNVDGLHQAAGTRTVLELHGSLAHVRCMSCGGRLRRHDHQRRLEALNPGVSEGAARIAPDGDAHLDGELERRFLVPPCERCGGILKPDVVFFGENVPKDRLAESWMLYEGADAIVVLGSSLSVFSGRRFVLRAARDGRPIAIVNEGVTRCDEMAQLKVEGRLGEVLPRIVELVRAPASPTSDG